jgi:predicted RND superfamily exporter protein
MVMTITPVLLSFGKAYVPVSTESAATASTQSVAHRATRIERGLAAFSDWVVRHAAPILIVFVCAAVVLAVGLTRMYVNMDYTRTYGLNVPFVKENNYISSTKVGAYNSYNIVLRVDTENGVKTPKFLHNLDRLLSEIEDFPIVKRTTSLLDIIKDMNQVMHDGDPASYRIPDDQALISQLLLLYEMSGSEQEHWVDYDYTIIRALVEITDFDTREVKRQFHAIQSRVENLFPQATFGVVGGVVQISVAQDYIARGELRSFLIAVCVVGVLMMLVFRSISIGLIGMVPNLMPVLVVGGVMGFGDIPVDMMTMMIIPMILGLAVDDTIHFMTHAKMEFQQTGRYRPALRLTFQTVGKSIFMTSFILVAAFSVYMTSVANVLFHLGLLVASGITAALLADYFVTPILIDLTRPFGKEEQK